MTEMHKLTVTAIIPVLGDAEPLARLLKIFEGAIDPPEEIIVVDGSEDRECQALCERYGCHYLSSRQGRGVQQNAGAAKATGKILWFVHADATPTGNATILIRETIASGSIGGYFRFHFAGPTNFMKEILEKLINFRARYGTPYGDQGLFATQHAYTNIGGFPDLPLFEEVPLVRRLRCIGKFTELPAPIGVSQRRWQRDGWIQRTLKNRWLACCYMLGASPDTLAQRYQPMKPAQRPPE